MNLVVLSFSQNAGEESVANIDKLLHSEGSIPTAELRVRLQKVMQNGAGVFRTQELLTDGIDKLNQVVADLDNVKVRVYNVFILRSHKLYF